MCGWENNFDLSCPGPQSEAVALTGGLGLTQIGGISVTTPGMRKDNTRLDRCWACQNV